MNRQPIRRKLNAGVSLALISLLGILGTGRFPAAQDLPTTPDTRRVVQKHVCAIGFDVGSCVIRVQSTPEDRSKQISFSGGNQATVASDSRRSAL
jgi:hypothetical protein